MLRNLLSENTIPSVLMAFFVTAGLMLGACSSSSSSNEDELFEDGVNINILDILGEENLNTLENDLDVPIHRGSNPPNIQAIVASLIFNNSEYGTMNQGGGAGFLIAPLVMKESVVPGDENRDPNSFWDLFIEMSNQNMEDYTINFRNRHIQEPQGTSTASYIMGEGDFFTIAGEVVNEWDLGDETVNVVSVQVLSGRLTDEGIADTHFAIMMVDNGEVPDRIPNGTGRSFEDGTGLSEPAEFPGTGDEQGRPAAGVTSVSGLLY
ncbi:MAG: hypothetical protein LAT84_11200 [Balneolia bacterium]|nr:hypothetical protein [Balneolia bacterium]